MEMVREQTDQWTQLMNAQRRTRWDLTKGRQSCCFCCWSCVIGLADAVGAVIGLADAVGAVNGFADAVGAVIGFADAVGGVVDCDGVEEAVVDVTVSNMYVILLCYAIQLASIAQSWEQASDNCGDNALAFQYCVYSPILINYRSKKLYCVVACGKVIKCTQAQLCSS